MWFVSIVLFVALMVGFLLPALFSAKHDEAVFLGVVLVVLFPVILWLMIKKITKRDIKNEKV
jgi:high-affinity Fe2+/Pb2+ permease